MQKRTHLDMPTVEQFMTRPVFTLRPDDDVMTALEQLQNRGFSGAPVIDDDGQLLGVMSELDCMRVTANAAFHVTPEGRVREHMTRSVEAITPDVDLFEVVTRFQQGMHRRLPVVCDGRLVGLVTRRDVLRALRQLSSARQSAPGESITVRGERRSALHA